MSQHSVAALALAERRPRPSYLSGPAEGAAKRSGAASRPENMRTKPGGGHAPGHRPQEARPSYPPSVDSIGPLTDPVTGRVIIADPHLPSRQPCCAAANLLGIAPNDLSVVATLRSSPAGISGEVVVTCLSGPRSHHLSRTGAATAYLEQVLAVLVLGPMGEPSTGKQFVGPLLRHGCQFWGPHQRRQPHPSTHLIVGRQHFAGHGVSAGLC